MNVSEFLLRWDVTSTIPIAPRVDDVCWWWCGSCNSNGYGTLRWEGKMVLAHRLFYFLVFGPIPKRKLILHACERPGSDIHRRCGNPNHLFVGTQRQNVNRHYPAPGKRQQPVSFDYLVTRRNKFIELLQRPGRYSGLAVEEALLRSD